VKHKQQSSKRQTAKRKLLMPWTPLESEASARPLFKTCVSMFPFSENFSFSKDALRASFLLAPVWNTSRLFLPPTTARWQGARHAKTRHWGPEPAQSPGHQSVASARQVSSVQVLRSLGNDRRSRTRCIVYISSGSTCPGCSGRGYKVFQIQVIVHRPGHRQIHRNVSYVGFEKTAVGAVLHDHGVRRNLQRAAAPSDVDRASGAGSARGKDP